MAPSLHVLWLTTQFSFCICVAMYVVQMSSRASMHRYRDAAQFQSVIDEHSHLCSVGEYSQQRHFPAVSVARDVTDVMHPTTACCDGNLAAVR